ncbi:MAG TPA: hypothetical protein VIK35_07365 [Verrucomicrobiae bacterium]
MRVSKSEQQSQNMNKIFSLHQFFKITFHGANLFPTFCPARWMMSIVIAVCGLGAVDIQASLAGWDMSGLAGGANNFGASPLAPNDIDPNLTIGGLTRGSGIGASGTAAAKAWGGSGFTTANNTEALAIAGGQFVTFTITADSGYEISIASISAYNIRRSGTAPATGIWQYEVGTGSFIDIGSAITWGATTSAAGNSKSAIDLSGISDLQNVAAGTTITFRIVDWGSTGTSGTWYFNDTGNTTGDDLQLQGAVSAVSAPVPEPAGYGLISAIGLLGICGVSTWRRHFTVKRARTIFSRKTTAF